MSKRHNERVDCWHEHIGDDGICLDCGARAAIPLDLEPPLIAEAAAVEPEPWTTDVGPEPQRVSPVKQLTRFKNQLVLEVDFTLGNPVTVAHSFNTNMLWVSVTNIGGTQDTPPAVTFTSPNSFSLTTPIGAGKFQVYVTVIP